MSSGEEFVPSDEEPDNEEDFPEDNDNSADDEVQHSRKRKKMVISSDEDEDAKDSPTQPPAARPTMAQKLPHKTRILVNSSKGASPRSPVPLGRKSGSKSKFKEMLQSRKSKKIELAAPPSTNARKGIVISTARDESDIIPTKQEADRAEVGFVPTKRKIPKNAEPLARTRYLKIGVNCCNANCTVINAHIYSGFACFQKRNRESGQKG